MRSFQLGNVSDEDLVRQLQRGAPDALALLFDRHYRLVFSVVHRVLRDTGEAEDLMQEVFLEVYRDAGNYDPARGSVKSWILEHATGLSLADVSTSSSPNIPVSARPLANVSAFRTHRL